MTAEQIDQALVKAQPIVFYNNLTASQGSICDRKMWFNFRNVSNIQYEAKTLKAFALGHTLEDLIVEWMKKAGYKITHRQERLTNKWGRTLAKIDGIIFYEGEHHLLEIKTAKESSFKKWLKDGVPDSYKSQVQLEMHASHQLSKKGNKLTKCLFVVMNKNTSELHTEIMEYEEQYATLQTERYENIIENESLPEASKSFECNWCDHKAVCEGETIARIDHCRTCSHVSVKDGSFECSHGKERCSKHVIHPQLVELLGYQVQGIDHENQAILFEKFALAEKGVRLESLPTFDSDELKLVFENNLINDDVLLEHKDMFDATLVTASSNEDYDF